MIGSTVLTEKPYSVTLAPDEAAIQFLRDMDKTLNSGGNNNSDLASIALPGRKLATSRKPRMLKPFEIELLQQDMKEALSIEAHDTTNVTGSGTLT